jgi:hypothetical protein
VQLFRTDIWCCMQSIRADPGKSFRPISLFGETIVLSHIAADSIGGILWGASSAPRRCANPPRGPDPVPQRPDLRSGTHPFQSRGQGTSFGAISSVFRRSELPDEFFSWQRLPYFSGITYFRRSIRACIRSAIIF